MSKLLPPGFKPVKQRPLPPGFKPVTQRARPAAGRPEIEPASAPEFLNVTDAPESPSMLRQPGDTILNRLATLNSLGDEEAIAALVKSRAPGAAIEKDEQGNLIVAMPNGERHYINKPGMSGADWEGLGYALGAELPAMALTRGRSGVIADLPKGILPMLGRGGKRFGAGATVAGTGAATLDALTALGQSQAGAQRPLVDPENAAISGTLGGAVEAVGGPILGKIVGWPLGWIQGGVEALQRSAAKKMPVDAARGLGQQVAERMGAAASLTDETLVEIGRNSKSGLPDEQAIRLAILNQRGAAPTTGMVTGNERQLSNEAQARAGYYGEERQKEFIGALDETAEGMRGVARRVVRGDANAETPNLTRLGETASAPAFATAEAMRKKGNEIYDWAEGLAAGAYIPVTELPAIRKNIANEVASRFGSSQDAVPLGVRRALDRIAGKQARGEAASDALAPKPQALPTILDAQGRPLRTTPDEPEGGPDAFVSLGDLLALRKELSAEARAGGPKSVDFGRAREALDKQIADLKSRGVLDPEHPGVVASNEADKFWRDYKDRFGRADATGRMVKADYAVNPDDPGRNMATQAMTGEQVRGILTGRNAATNIKNLYEKLPAGSRAGDDLRSAYRTMMYENLMSGLLDDTGKFKRGAGKMLSDRISEAKKDGVLELVLGDQDVKALRESASALDLFANASYDKANPSGSATGLATRIGNFLRNPNNLKFAGMASIGAGGSAAASGQDAYTTAVLGAAPIFAFLTATAIRDRAGQRVARQQLRGNVAALQQLLRRRPGSPRAASAAAGAFYEDDDED